MIVIHLIRGKGSQCYFPDGALTNMFAEKILPFLVAFLQVKGQCLTGSCEKISLDVHRDAVQDSEFVGHVFHSCVTLNPIQCYTWCIQDCRCLSFNYKKNNEEKYCELNEANHFTNNGSLKNSTGSSYYILRREYQAKVSKKHKHKYSRVVNSFFLFCNFAFFSPS